MDSEFIKSPDAARMLGLVPGTLRAWRVRGRGPRYYKFGQGGPVMYKRSELEAWIAERNMGSTSEQTAREAAA